MWRFDGYKYQTIQSMSLSMNSLWKRFKNTYSEGEKKYILAIQRKIQKLPEKELEETTEDSMPASSSTTTPVPQKKRKEEKKTAVLMCDILEIRNIIQRVKYSIQKGEERVRWKCKKKTTYLSISM